MDEEKRFDVSVTYIPVPVWHARGESRWQEMEAHHAITVKNVRVNRLPGEEMIEVSYLSGDKELIMLGKDVKRVTIKTHEAKATHCYSKY